jgi:hypothetical protein
VAVAGFSASALLSRGSYELKNDRLAWLFGVSAGSKAAQTTVTSERLIPTVSAPHSSETVTANDTRAVDRAIVSKQTVLRIVPGYSASMSNPRRRRSETVVVLPSVVPEGLSRATSDHDIARRAYEFYEDRGGAPGLDIDDVNRLRAAYLEIPDLRLQPEQVERPCVRFA